MTEQTAPPIKATDKAATLENLLAKVTPKLQLVAPRGYDVQRLSSIMVDLLMATPDLLACAETPAGRNSFATAVMHIAALGLDASRVRKQVHVVPFKTSKKDKTGKWISYTSAVLILDARGIIELMRRTGLFEGVIAKPVYKTDYFEYVEAPEPTIIHKPDIDRPTFERFWPSVKQEGDATVYDWSDTNCEAAQIRGFYCLIKIKGESPLIGYMSMDAMLKRRAQSRAANSGPWVDWFVEMGIKTIVKATARHAPLSAEVMRAFALDDEIETGERPALPPNGDGKPVDLSDVVEYEEVTNGDASAVPPTKTDKVKQQLAAKAEPAPAPPSDEPGEPAPPAAPEPEAQETTIQEASVKAQAPLPKPNEAKAKRLAMVCSDFNVGKLWTERLLKLDPPSHAALMQALFALQQNYGEDIRDSFSIGWERGAMKSWTTFKAFCESGVLHNGGEDASPEQQAEPDTEPESEAFDPTAEYKAIAQEFSLIPQSRDFMLEHEPSPAVARAYFTHLKQVAGLSINGRIAQHIANHLSWDEAMREDGFDPEVVA